MPAITATFETRREAELAVEHLVQEHDIDRAAIVLGTEDEDNSAGSMAGGADSDDPEDDAEGAAFNGGIVVTATVEADEDAEAVQDVFHEFGGSDVSQKDE